MEERKTHLQQARDNRHERLHAESIAEREIWLRETEIIIDSNGQYTLRSLCLNNNLFALG